jgi:hypothetical protein
LSTVSRVGIAESESRSSETWGLAGSAISEAGIALAREITAELRRKLRRLWSCVSRIMKRSSIKEILRQDDPWLPRAVAQKRRGSSWL